MDLPAASTGKSFGLILAPFRLGRTKVIDGCVGLRPADADLALSGRAYVNPADDPRRFDRLVAIAPYVHFENDAAPLDPQELEEWRTDWAGFIGPFMQVCFTGPDSTELIAEMTAMGLEATPEVIVTQALELDWTRSARLLRSTSCPTLVIHGDSDATTPLFLVQSIIDAMPNARPELIPGGGHRPDIRSPELVNPLLKAFLLD